MSGGPHIRATPFHARSAANNPFNRWIARNGFTLPLDFGDAQEEAFAARASVALLDISWRSRLLLAGANAGECVSRLMTRDARRLQPGQSLKALWLNDAGGVRGAGVVARFATDQFLILSAADDRVWIGQAADQFGVSVRELTEEHGGLAVVGPYAKAVLEAAGFEAGLDRLHFRKLLWRGLDMTLSRWGEQDGFEIWCNTDDGLLLWDRLMHAGAPYAIRPAGLAASDILDIEAGIPRPHRDYRPALDNAPTPSSASLGVESLIDETHRTFNGFASWRKAPDAVDTALIGIEIDSETPAPFAPLIHAGTVAGHTLTSVHSPTLRRAIALAKVEKRFAEPGTVFSLTLPLAVDRSDPQQVAGRAVSLPFIKTSEVL